MNILKFDRLEVWTQAIVDLWRARLEDKGGMKNCLPSGHTPLPVYAATVQAVRSGKMSFRHAEIFALDEYGGLPARDPGRCAMILQRRFIERIDLPSGRFHHFNPEAQDLRLECESYDAKIGNGFDLAILGVGLNGHLGLNEPGSSPDSPTRRVGMHPASTAAAAQYVKNSVLPEWGVTIGLKRLLESREVWLLATGSKKAEIVGRILHGPVTPEVPASLLRRHPRAYLFVDAAAGALC